MALKKETQIILGVGTASIIGYLYWKNNYKKKFSSFVQSEFDSCVADGNQPIDCCAKLGGVFEGGVCKQPTQSPQPSCPDGIIVNGLCVDTQPSGSGGSTETEGTGSGGTSSSGETTTSGGSGGTTTTIITSSTPVILPPPVYFTPISRGTDAGDGGGGGSADAAVVPTDEFDWIPIILGGMTVALSIISEN